MVDTAISVMLMAGHLIIIILIGYFGLMNCGDRTYHPIAASQVTRRFERGDDCGILPSL